MPLRRLAWLPIAALMVAAAFGQGRAPDDLPSVFNEPAFASCIASPSDKCVLLLATQVALRAERKEDAGRDLSRIAAAQAKAGFRDDTETTIKLALGYLDQVAQAYHYEILDNTVDALGGLGKIDDALRLAKADTHAFARGSLLTIVAKHRARVVGTADALALLLPLPPYERHLAIRRLAWTMRYAVFERGEEGLLIEALRLVERQEMRLGAYTGIHYIAEFPPALFILAHPLAETGKFGEGWDLAQTIRHELERKAALSHLALMEVCAGGITAGLRRVAAMDDAPARSEVLQEVLNDLAGTGWLEGILTAGIDDGMPVKPRRFAAATAQDLAEALVMTRAMADERRDRAVALSIIAAVQAQSGMISDALSTARSVTDSEARYFAFRIVARHGSAAGRNPEAKVAYDEAYGIAKTFDPPSLRDRRLSPLAIGMAKVGFIKEALDVVASMKGNLSNGFFGVDDRIANADSERRYALYAIAQAQAKQGSVSEAITTARSIEREGEILGLEVGIVAFGLAEQGRIAEAISVATTEIPNIYRRNRILLAIAEKRATAGEYGEALRIAEAMADDAEKVSALGACPSSGWSSSGESDSLPEHEQGFSPLAD
jgi:hypothetical protein